jgi:hypothetical protein
MFLLFWQELYFDIVAPKPLLQNGDLLLRFEVWNDSTFSDDLLGHGVMSVMEFFENRAVKRDWYPLEITDAQGDRIPAGEVLLEFKFEPTYRGILVLTCYDGQNLRNRQVLGESFVAFYFPPRVMIFALLCFAGRCWESKIRTASRSLGINVSARTR